MNRNLEEILKNTKQNDECLEWTLCLNSDGYPRALIDGNSNTKVHRVVFELHSGEYLGTRVVRHTCDNKKCINPFHLISGMPRDNVKDMDIRGRRYRIVTPDKIQRVKALFKTNLLSQKEIAKIVDLDYRRVSDIFRNIYNDDATLARH